MVVEYIRCIHMKEEGFSVKEISMHLGISQPTVRSILAFAKQQGLNAEKAAEMGNTALSQLHHPKPAAVSDRFHQPDMAYVHKQLAAKGMTLLYLWENYVDLCPPGYDYYRYSRFCQLYAEYAGSHNLTMRHARLPVSSVGP